jgi:hypothetical protein
MGMDHDYALLVEQARRALVHELGAAKVDVWLGKDGLVQHDVAELAAIAIGALQPLLTPAEAAALADRCRQSGLHELPRRDPNDW